MVSVWLLPPPLHLPFWATFSCTAGDELSCPRGLRSSPCSSRDAFLTFFLSPLSFFPLCSCCSVARDLRQECFGVTMLPECPWGGTLGGDTGRESPRPSVCHLCCPLVVSLFAIPRGLSALLCTLQVQEGWKSGQDFPCKRCISLPLEEDAFTTGHSVRAHPVMVGSTPRGWRKHCRS